MCVSAQFLAEADTNKDGVVTLDEFKSYCARHPELLHQTQELADKLRPLLEKHLVSSLSTVRCAFFFLAEWIMSLVAVLAHSHFSDEQHSDK